MISVKYKPKRHSLSVTGHAYSGEAGNDLICAACSALTYTFAVTVKKYDKNGAALCSLEKGKARIVCGSHTDEENRVLDIALGAIINGFELLAESYPENIILKIL